MESQIVCDFQDSISQGNWSQAVELIPFISNQEEGAQEKVTDRFSIEPF